MNFERILGLFPDRLGPSSGQKTWALWYSPGLLLENELPSLHQPLPCPRVSVHFLKQQSKDVFT